MPVVLELADQQGPFGARGVAEMPLVPFLPAVAARHPRCHRRLAHGAAVHSRARADFARRSRRHAPERIATKGALAQASYCAITAGPYEFRGPR